MKIRTAIGLAGATAASLVGMAGLAASPAGAAAAQTGPVQDVIPFPIPLFGQLVSAGTFHNDKVTGNCESAAPWLFSDSLALFFVSGNAALYRGINAVNGLPNGLNAEGTAVLFDNGSPTSFVGHAHVWLGQNANANGTSYGGQTVNFSGTAPDGSTISIIVNPGFIYSAGGHSGGWGQQNLSCNIIV